MSKVLFIRFFVILITVYSYACEKKMTENSIYYSMQENYDKACEALYRNDLNGAKIIFKKIIEKDTYNVFWESYYYLSHIYFNECKKDSALFIIDEGLKNDSPDLNASHFLEVVLYSIRNHNMMPDIRNSKDWEILEKISYHIYPDVMPKLEKGYKKFNNDIKNIIKCCSINGINNKIIIFLVIDKDGNVARIKIGEDQIDNAILLKAMYQYIFNSKWLPAKKNGKTISWWIGIQL